MSRYRIESSGEVWWVGYDQHLGGYFAERADELETDDHPDRVYPSFADLERVTAGRLTIAPTIRGQLIREGPAEPAETAATVGADAGQFAAAVQDANASPLEAQRQITAIALHTIEGAGFALAGSGAIREHGIIDRPTEDIDLFTSSLDERSFADAVDALSDELTGRGYTVQVDPQRRSPQFARLQVGFASGDTVQIDLAMDWRESPAVQLEVGPVLELEDAVQGKLSALYTRAEPRDFLDVDAIRRSGRYTDAQLLAGAEQRDPGFTRDMFATQLRLATRIDVREVAKYGVDAAEWQQIAARVTGWGEQLEELGRRP